MRVSVLCPRRRELLRQQKSHALGDQSGARCIPRLCGSINGGYKALAYGNVEPYRLARQFGPNDNSPDFINLFIHLDQIEWSWTGNWFLILGHTSEMKGVCLFSVAGCVLSRVASAHASR